MHAVIQVEILDPIGRVDLCSPTWPDLCFAGAEGGLWRGVSADKPASPAADSRSTGRSGDHREGIQRAQAERVSTDQDREGCFKCIHLS